MSKRVTMTLTTKEFLILQQVLTDGVDLCEILIHHEAVQSQQAKNIEKKKILQNLLVKTYDRKLTGQFIKDMGISEAQYEEVYKGTTHGEQDEH